MLIIYLYVTAHEYPPLKRKDIFEQMTDFNRMAEELLHILCENARLRYRRELNDFSYGELSILTVLSSSEKGLSPGEMCDILGMTTPRVSAAISGLKRKGYVISKPDSEDRRKVNVSITEEGLSLISAKREEISEFIAAVLTDLGKDDAEEYVRILGKINTIASVSIV